MKFSWLFLEVLFLLMGNGSLGRRAWAVRSPGGERVEGKD